MKRIMFFLLMTLLVPSYAYAQESVPVNYDKCEYDKIYTNTYAPFYFHINHDPAISQTFKQSHIDNPSVSPFQRAPEGAEPGKATWFEFGSIANATATYEFELGLEYLESSDVPRPIIIQLFSQGVLMEEKKILQEDNIGCVAFRISVTPPPHVFTNDEIFQLSKLGFINELTNTTKQYTDRLDQNTEETKGLKMQLIATNIIVVFLIVFLYITNKMTKNQMRTIESEYNIRNNMMATSVLKLDANLKNEQFRLLKMDRDNQSMTSTIVGNFGHMIEKIRDVNDDVKKDVKKFIDDLRKEIDMVSNLPEEPVITFADSEKHDSSDDCVIISKKNAVVLPDNKSDEPVGKIFGFDLGIIKNTIVKSFENIAKKEEPGLSEIDKLTNEWINMSNEDLSKVYMEYLEKATSDLHANTYGKNYECAVIILKIINDRTVDVSKNG